MYLILIDSLDSLASCFLFSLVLPCYTPLCEKGIKQKQIRPIETTYHLYHEKLFSTLAGSNCYNSPGLTHQVLSTLGQKKIIGQKYCSLLLDDLFC